MISALDPLTAADEPEFLDRPHVTVNVRCEVDRSPISFGLLRWFARYMNRRLRKFDDGSALAIPDKNGIWCQLQTTSLGSLQHLLASLAQDFERCNEHLRYTVVWPAPRWGDDTQRLARKYATLHVSLSRNMFLSLRPGTVITGNFASGWLLPQFRLTVRSHQCRQRQWLRIRQTNADRRNCVVYLSTESLNAWSGLSAYARRSDDTSG